ncbi:nucleotide excision repair, TFIIH, subunit [Pseudovirgaria hyperparasitica]|uniref:General transcription and DNA repair factor IIH subunit TFB5 n=1 Tax=Pseudovirgaria hyperparasitica TaxID=470096 RepID=A0A6A6WBN6_9PEZI|nr:nucleotide excision repair, TFIIH, subunit [Pseudovirgaria hyperparasitica]KAF2758521.1 nucleotide excision repair, TFIIH, subunit [Pseudovirgaria hyperparasitica]
MVRATKGVLVQCDASIKAIILKIDAGNSDFIIEELDDETLLVKENKLKELQMLLKKQLDDTLKYPEESDSD